MQILRIEELGLHPHIYLDPVALRSFYALNEHILEDEGRVELLHYLQEQSIAFEYHRYGSITDNVNE